MSFNQEAFVGQLKERYEELAKQLESFNNIQSEMTRIKKALRALTGEEVGGGSGTTSHKLTPKLRLVLNAIRRGFQSNHAIAGHLKFSKATAAGYTGTLRSMGLIESTERDLQGGVNARLYTIKEGAEIDGETDSGESEDHSGDEDHSGGDDGDSDSTLPARAQSIINLIRAGHDNADLLHKQLGGLRDTTVAQLSRLARKGLLRKVGKIMSDSDRSIPVWAVNDSRPATPGYKGKGLPLDDLLKTLAGFPDGARTADIVERLGRTGDSVFTSRVSVQLPYLKNKKLVSSARGLYTLTAKGKHKVAGMLQQ